MKRRTVPLLIAGLSFALLHCSVEQESISPDEYYGYGLESASSTFNGRPFHWNSRPVRVSLTDCTALSGCTSEHLSSVRAGAETWMHSASLFGEFDIEWVNSDPDVAISWIQVFNAPNEGVIGQCVYRLGATYGGRIFAYRPWTIQMAMDVIIGGSQKKISQNGIQLVAAHEMGHCLGLFQHSPVATDLMHAYLSGSTSYTRRDVTTLRKAYSESSESLSSNVSGSVSAEAAESLIMSSPAVSYPSSFAP